MCKQLAVLLFGLGIVSLSNSALGQLPYRSYSPPAGQTLPMQLEYFRPQSGVLDQYNQFVAPRENLSNQLRAMVGQQNSDYQAVQTRFNQSEMVRAPVAAATGTAAGFMNYSHYFGAKGTGAGPSRQITYRQRYSTSLPGVGTGAGLPLGIGSGIGPNSGTGGFRFGR